MRWTAPEALEERKYSSKSDCWSFGILMYEIWTRAETPYHDMTNQKVWTAVLGGYRLGQPENCPMEVHGLMLHCWHVNPDMRPAFADMATQLREMEADEVNLAQRRKDSQYDFALLDNLKPVEEHAYVDFTSGTDSIPPIFQDHMFYKGNRQVKPIFFAQELTSPGTS